MGGEGVSHMVAMLARHGFIPHAQWQAEAMPVLEPRVRMLCRLNPRMAPLLLAGMPAVFQGEGRVAPSPQLVTTLLERLTPPPAPPPPAAPPAAKAGTVRRKAAPATAAASGPLAAAGAEELAGVVAALVEYDKRVPPAVLRQLVSELQRKASGLGALVGARLIQNLALAPGMAQVLAAPPLRPTASSLHLKNGNNSNRAASELLDELLANLDEASLAGLPPSGLRGLSESLAKLKHMPDALWRDTFLAAASARLQAAAERPQEQWQPQQQWRAPGGGLGGPDGWQPRQWQASEPGRDVGGLDDQELLDLTVAVSTLPGITSSDPDPGSRLSEFQAQVQAAAVSVGGLEEGLAAGVVAALEQLGLKDVDVQVALPTAWHGGGVVEGGGEDEEGGIGQPQQRAAGSRYEARRDGEQASRYRPQDAGETPWFTGSGAAGARRRDGGYEAPRMRDYGYFGGEQGPGRAAEQPELGVGAWDRGMPGGRGGEDGQWDPPRGGRRGREGHWEPPQGGGQGGEEGQWDPPRGGRRGGGGQWEPPQGAAPGGRGGAGGQWDVGQLDAAWGQSQVGGAGSGMSWRGGKEGEEGLDGLDPADLDPADLLDLDPGVDKYGVDGGPMPKGGGWLREGRQEEEGLLAQRQRRQRPRGDWGADDGGGGGWGGQQGPGREEAGAPVQRWQQQVTRGQGESRGGWGAEQEGTRGQREPRGGWGAEQDVLDEDMGNDMEGGVEGGQGEGAEGEGEGGGDLADDFEPRGRLGAATAWSPSASSSWSGPGFGSSGAGGGPRIQGSERTYGARLGATMARGRPQQQQQEQADVRQGDPGLEDEAGERAAPQEEEEGEVLDLPVVPSTRVRRMRRVRGL